MLLIFLLLLISPKHARLLWVCRSPSLSLFTFAWKRSITYIGAYIRIYDVSIGETELMGSIYVMALFEGAWHSALEQFIYSLLSCLASCLPASVTAIWLSFWYGCLYYFSAVRLHTVTVWSWNPIGALVFPSARNGFPVWFSGASAIMRLPSRIFNTSYHWVALWPLFFLRRSFDQFRTSLYSVESTISIYSSSSFNRSVSTSTWLVPSCSAC